MGGDKAGASQGFAVIRLGSGPWVLAGWVRSGQAGWLGRHHLQGLGAGERLWGGSRKGDGLGQSLGVPRCAGLWQAQLLTSAEGSGMGSG